MKLPFAGRLLAVAVLAAASAALPVSAAFAETTEKPKVALVMKSLANEFFLTMEDGAKAYQKDHSGEFDLISNGIKDETDTAGQTRIVEQMILAKVNALVIAPADSKAMVPVIKESHRCRYHRDQHRQPAGSRRRQKQKHQCSVRRPGQPQGRTPGRRLPGQTAEGR
ncbi:UNVERIFIED_ORG: hypothetical protein OKW15_004236 [Pseudomonas reinekei]|nr:hypothetical protein [Pseudomonas reinekei]